MKESRRLEKLNQLLKEKIARIVLYHLNDPRLGFLTITRVKLAADLKKCLVFYSIIGTEADQVKTEHALNSARGYVQKTVAQTLKTRQTPILEFMFDPSIEGSIRVSKIIDRLTKEREEKERARDEEEDSSLSDEEKGDDKKKEAVHDEP